MKYLSQRIQWLQDYCWVILQTLVDRGSKFTQTAYLPNLHPRGFIPEARCGV